MAGVITGQAFKDSDPAVQRILNEWKQFYPINQSVKEDGDANIRQPNQQQHANAPFHIDLDDVTPQSNVTEAANPSATANTAKLPAVVEVVVAGMKMKYPSCFVYLANNASDSPLVNLGPSANLNKAHSTLADGLQPASSTSTNSGLLTPPSSPEDSRTDTTAKLKAPVMAPRQPVQPSASFRIRSSVCQEMNVFPSDKRDAQSKSNQQSNDSSNQQQATSGASDESVTWEFSDPCARVGCNCFRCKVSKKGNNQNAKSNSSLNNIPNSMSSGGNKKLDKAEKLQQAKSAKQLGIPFHKRSPVSDLCVDPEESHLTDSHCSSQSGLVASGGPGAGSNTASSNQQPNQPKTPSNFAYKSPMCPGGLPSIQSNATTPCGIDSPRSAAPSFGNGDGPPSTNPEPLSLPSVSPCPVRDEPGPSPAVVREKTHLEQLLSPYQNTPSARAPNSNRAEDPPSVGGPGSLPTASNLWVSGNSEVDATNVTSSEIVNGQSSNTGIKRPLLVVAHEDSEPDRSTRNCFLYDYSSFNSVVSGWDLPAPKKRRVICSDRDSVLNDSGSFSNTKHRDPYEFSEFDDDHARNGQHAEVDAQTNGPQLSNGELNGENEGRDQKGSNLSQDSGLAASPGIFTREPDLNAASFETLPDQIFDTSSGEDSNDMGFPAPTSIPGKLVNGKDKQSRSNNNSSSTSIHCVSELTMMFPTPPSLEPNAAPSPCNSGNDASLLDDSGPIYPYSPNLEHLKVSLRTTWLVAHTLPF